MSITAYFAKINLESHILEVYKGNKNLKTILGMLIRNFNSDIKHISTSFYEDENGVKHETNIEYTIGSVQKLNENYNNSIVGYIYKKSTVFLKTLDEKTGEIVWRGEPNTEVITFYFDVYKEKIVFHTTQRFGYNEFCEAMEGIINGVFNEDFKFVVELYRESISIDNIKNELQKLGNITEIRIDIKAPNANEKLLSEIEKAGSDMLEDYKEGNITSRSIILTSKAPKGIDLDSKIVSDEFDAINKIHQSLSAEEAIKNGYVHVNASTNKKKYTTQDMKPLKGFFEESEKAIGQFIEVGKKLLSYINIL